MTDYMSQLRIHSDDAHESLLDELALEPVELTQLSAAPGLAQEQQRQMMEAERSLSGSNTKGHQRSRSSFW